MKKLLTICLLAVLALAVNAAEETRLSKINAWFTWKGKNYKGKVIRQRPSKEFPHGVARFVTVPGEQKYSMCTYGNEDIAFNSKVKIVVTVKYSADVNSDVEVTLSLKGKDAANGWYAPFAKQVKPARVAKFAVEPGKEVKAEVEVDLGAYKLPGMKKICPFISAANLKSGQVEVVKAELVINKPDAAK